MKISIELNKNELYDIVIKVGNTTKRIYDASEIKIKNNIIYGRVNNKIIVNLISELIKLNIKIKDLRIDNKILEDILLKLS